MKRLHVHVAVESLQRAIDFYTALFAEPPTVLRSDYAKWMLDDPCVNFAISMRGREPGVDHLGIQVEDKAELNEVYARLQAAGGPVIDQGQTKCCYARSEKSWIDDPAGIAWEAFLTTGESTDYGDGTGERTAPPLYPPPRAGEDSIDNPPPLAGEGRERGKACCMREPAPAVPSACCPE